MGIGQNISGGRVSFDVTWASDHFDTQQDERELSYRFNYSKQVDATNSTISRRLWNNRSSFSQLRQLSGSQIQRQRCAGQKTDDQLICGPASAPAKPQSLRQQKPTWVDADASTTASIWQVLMLILVTGSLSLFRRHSIQPVRR